MKQTVKILQSNVVNRLMQFDTNNYQPVEVTRRGVFEKEFYVVNDNNSLVIRLEHPTNYDGKLKLADFNFSVTTHRLLMYIRELFTLRNDAKIDFSIKDYMNRCMLKDRKYTRKQLERDLYALSAIRYFADYDDSYIIESFSMHHGRVYLELFYKFVEEIQSHNNYILLPLNYYKINIQRFHAAPGLLYYLLIHECMNKRKKNSNRIRISSLLKRGQFPTVEAVRMSECNAIKRRIVEPFFQTLHSISGMVSFRFYDEYNEELSESEVKKLPYDDFARVLVQFKFLSK